MNIIDHSNLLSTVQTDALRNGAALDFLLGDFSSLNDILTKLDVDVIIEPGLHKYTIPADFFEDAKDYWEKKFDKEEKFWRKRKANIEKNKEGQRPIEVPEHRPIDGPEDENEETVDCESDVEEHLNNIGNLRQNRLSDIDETATAIVGQLMLGCYKPAENNIYLYPDAMKLTDARNVDVLLVLVLAHESMHAYFNRTGHEKYPYALFVEEPLAEFGMLVYLNETESPYLTYGLNFVRTKHSCYRYGALIYDLYFDGDSSHRDFLEGYKINLLDGIYSFLPDFYSFQPKHTAVTSLSKSRYTLSTKCQKALWLDVYDQDKKKVDPGMASTLEVGNQVGELAKGLLGPYVDVTVKVGTGALDIGSMIQRTQDCLKTGVENICEASFSFTDTKYGTNYCAVDILHKNGNGYDIYEVKSSSSDDKDDDQINSYITDIAYQKWVLTYCGINIKDCFLVRIKKGFVKHGAILPSNFFVSDNISKEVAKEYPNVPNNVLKALKTLSRKPEPCVKIGIKCNAKHECAFKDYCFRNVSKPSVFDLYGFSKKKKWALYDSGKRVFQDLSDADLGAPSSIRRFQVIGRPYIDRMGIGNFLKKLRYPLYYLDFETMQLAIPPYDGIKAFQQLPFQYSLHYQNTKGGTLYHTEFLAESGVDPRLTLAEQICKDIPADACVLAYNKSFECMVLKDLADHFASLPMHKHLQSIANNIEDLYEPFRKGYYYLPVMGDSVSIKSVLPALYPNDPAFDYHNLPGCVHNGGEAMHIFPKIKDMAEPERTKTRNALLEYCKLDTLAMVKVLEKLYEV